MVMNISFFLEITNLIKEELLVYSVSGYTKDIYELVIMTIFFVLLTLGFFFELRKNALTSSYNPVEIRDYDAFRKFTSNNLKKSAPPVDLSCIPDLYPHLKTFIELAAENSNIQSELLDLKQDIKVMVKKCSLMMRALRFSEYFYLYRDMLNAYNSMHLTPVPNNTPAYLIMELFESG